MATYEVPADEEGERVTDQSGHEEWHERYLNPQEVTPAQLAHADQHVANIAHWIDTAVHYLSAHVEDVHGGDAGKCAAYCGDADLFNNIEKLDRDELQMLVLQLLHAEMRRRRVVGSDRG